MWTGHTMQVRLWWQGQGHPKLFYQQKGSVKMEAETQSCEQHLPLPHVVESHSKKQQAHRIRKHKVWKRRWQSLTTGVCVWGGGEPVTILRWKASIPHGTNGGISMLTQSSTRITSLCCALSTLDRAKSKEMTRCCRKRLEQWTPRGKNTRLHHRTNFNTKVCMCLEVYCVTQQKEETTTWHVILTILTFQSLSALLTV